jgi:DNA polymerase-1
MAEPRTLYLVDGHAQFFRAYYAIRTRMSSPVTREPTNMTYGFMGMLLKLLRDHAPDYLAVVIDASGDRGTFRSQLYPEYKANRDEPPDDFRPQVDRCLELLEAMHIPVIAEEGVEADDVIATIVRRLEAEDPELRIRIVSKDKDLTQLLRENVELFDANKDEPVTPSDIFKTEGVEPRHVVDILTLMGDSVDNVPGVAGIGPKTAAKLILEYGSVDNLLEHLDAIKGKRRENIEAARDQLPLSRRLVELKSDLDLAFTLEDAVFDPKAVPVAPVLGIFQQLNFGMHGDTLRSIAGAPDARPEAPAPATATAVIDEDDALAGGLFAGIVEQAETPKPPPTDGAYECVATLEALDAVIDRVRAAGRCAVDTETDAALPMFASLCGISIAVEEEHAWYIPVRSPEPETHLDLPAVRERLGPLLADPAIEKAGHNIKYDMVVLRHHGMELAGRLFDTMIASYVIDATRSSHKLDVLVLAKLGRVCTPLDDLLGKGRSQRTFDEVPLAEAVPYAAEDADVTLRLARIFADELEETGLRTLFDEVEMPLVNVLAELEYNGIHVDPDELDRQREKLAGRIDDLARSIGDAAPHPFNPDSPKQLAKALFNAPDDDPPGLGLRVIKRGKTGPSTDQEVLEKLAADLTIESAVPRLILEYRQLTKLVRTYLLALKDAIHPETKRVHASFNQTVAATGRLSSSDPNLQNIPVRTEVGREIRRAFTAEPGRVLITADYSQIELRLLAHLAADPALQEAFREGMDIHTAVAAEVFDVKPEQVTAEQRGTAKMVNFGIVYGITAFGLSRRLGGALSVTEAGHVIADYKVRFHQIEKFLEECVEQGMREGYVETMLGRRRLIPQLQGRHPQQKALGERMAINTAVQGSAADLIKLAMIDLHRTLPERHPEVRMVLQIHDELVFEAPSGEAEAVAAFVTERMEGAMELAVPLVVDTAWSECWIDAK